MDMLVGKMAFVLAKFFGDELGGLDVEHPPVMRQRHVNIRPELIQRLHERS